MFFFRKNLCYRKTGNKIEVANKWSINIDLRASLFSFVSDWNFEIVATDLFWIDILLSLLFYFLSITTSSHLKCSMWKGVLRNFTTLTGKHLCQSLFFNKFAAFIKKETLAQVFSCQCCEISKNTFFTEHLWTTASLLRYLLGIINKQPFHDNKNVIRKASFSGWTIHFGSASVTMFMGNCARGSRGSRNCARGSFSSFFCCRIAIMYAFFRLNWEA